MPGPGLGGEEGTILEEPSLIEASLVEAEPSLIELGGTGLISLIEETGERPVVGAGAAPGGAQTQRVAAADLNQTQPMSLQQLAGATDPRATQRMEVQALDPRATVRGGAPGAGQPAAGQGAGMGLGVRPLPGVRLPGSSPELTVGLSVPPAPAVQREPSLMVLTDETLLPLPADVLARRLNLQRIEAADDPSRIRPVPLGQAEPETQAVPLPGMAPPPERTETRRLGEARPGVSGSFDPKTGSRMIRLAHRVQQRMGLGGATRPVRRGGLSLQQTLGLVILLCSIGALGVVGGRMYRQRRLDGLAAEAAVLRQAAEERGALSDLLAAAEAYGRVLQAQPADEPALAARAHLLTRAVYEHGEPLTSPRPVLEQDGGAAPDSPLREEAARAAGLVLNEVDADAQAAQVYLALLTGDYGGAGRRARALGDTQPALGDYLQGLSALSRGSAGEAATLLQRSLRSAPRSTSAHEHLAQALLLDGKEEAALGELTEALRLNPEHPGAYSLRLWLRAVIEARGAARAADSREGDAGDLVRVRKALLESSGARAGWLERARAELWAADLMLRQRPADVSGAREILDRLQATDDGGDVNLGEQLGEVLLRARQPALAEKAARRVLQRAAGRRGARQVLIEALLQQHRADEARQALQPLLDVDRLVAVGARAAPGVWDGRLVLLAARVLLGLDQTLPAQALLEPLMQGDGADAAAAGLLLCRTALLLGDTKEAQALIGRMEGRMGGLSVAQRHELLVLQARHALQVRPPRRAQGEAALQQAVLLWPEGAEAHLLLGQLLRARGELPAARDELKRAVAGVGGEGFVEVQSRRELAEVALQQGDAGVARGLYDQLLQSEADADVLLGAAQAHRLSGDLAGALRVLTTVRAAGGERAKEDALRRERARVLTELGRIDEAQRLLQRGP